VSLTQRIPIPRCPSGFQDEVPVQGRPGEHEQRPGAGSRGQPFRSCTGCSPARLSGWPSRAPLLVLAGGLVAAPFYTIDKVVHFILLGLLWRPARLHMAWTAVRQLNRRTAAEPAAPHASMVP
jgi:hypothetical protein